MQYKDYKDTLILPQTNFPMRGNLPKKEPQRYAKWQDNAYSFISRKRKVNKEFINSKNDREQQNSSNHNLQFTLHDGPPYANGHLHVGHALNKILKDFIVKLHYFRGKQVFYTPGWDCHGLPIEQQVSSQFESKNIKPSKLETRQACREHAEKFIEIQKQEFISMGIVGDFDNPYKTMDYHFEANIYRALVKIASKGLLIQRSKPIFWSWAARSALAEAEVEYKDKKSDSIYVAFTLSKEALISLNIESFSTSRKPFIAIWTTTPWTLPSNVAISLNPNEVYVLLKDGAIVAKKRHEALINMGIASKEILCELDAKKFEYLKAINPLNSKESMLILAEYVSMQDGTGAVHNAPGHGEDDYFSCLKYGLPVIMPVDDSGLFDSNVVKQGLFESSIAKEFDGMHIFKAQKRILEILKEHQALLFHEEITHSYPHCWRTSKPIIFRATKQWFILMDKPYHNGKTLREVALEEIDKTRFYPSNGINRIRTMVQNRPDWCVSRQRDWGVPLAFLLDKQSGEPLLDSEVTDFIADLFEKYGCDVWWEREIRDLLPPSFRDKAHLYNKNMHILDVWFDSGSTWFAVLNNIDSNLDSKTIKELNSKYNSGFYPSSMYLEGSDQHRGWFQSSLLVSCAINYKAPFMSVVTHGFTVDEKSEKMSKSKGNVLSPSSIIKNNGSEIMRLWVALSDYQNDVKISQNILKQVSENYLKIRNTIRFLLANTQGLKVLNFENLSPIDIWILIEANKAFAQIEEFFNIYDFSKGFMILNSFLTASLSGIYLDICKDSLYCDSSDSPRRISIQSVFGLLANHILHLLAPFLTYTVDEALEYAESILKGNASNVFELEKIPMPNMDKYSNIKYENFNFLLELRRLFNEQVDRLKKEKIIKSSLELEIHTSDFISEGFDNLMADFLMVSACSINKSLREDSNGEEFSIKINDKTFFIFKAKKRKCLRCWQYKVASDNELDICPRCKEVLKNK
ncbi:isoleucine--tRNA ligase [Helicobacter muridarum]|uniref:Isoleucine--tRNA ligase n=1 Tax=Helicobacter muridarum TaxID=216 RepID=A0A099TZK7_9HELI|nr:isoleucine--tRNA ligase [Helicobacter muridarum]TLE00847.1 isoleucine--tRNA ligase [Helicobacter muridarum]STQ86615.1 isoleucyl-tRNA synthetase [Helicobacter muridarum]